jgi:hypothetical protein
MNAVIREPERPKLSYNITVRRHPARTIEALEILHAQGKHEQANKLLQQGDVCVRDHNIIVDSPDCGFDLIRQWLISALIGSNPFPYGPGYGEIGTGTTAVATTDTALATSVARTAISNAVNNGSGSTAILQFYFSDAILANTTYHEFGTFVGGGLTIGSGQMFNHVLFTSPYIKSSGNDTTCEVDFSLTN